MPEVMALCRCGQRAKRNTGSVAGRDLQDAEGENGRDDSFRTGVHLDTPEKWNGEQGEEEVGQNADT